MDTSYHHLPYTLSYNCHQSRDIKTVICHEQMDLYALCSKIISGNPYAILYVRRGSIPFVMLIDLGSYITVADANAQAIILTRRRREEIFGPFALNESKIGWTNSQWDGRVAELKKTLRDNTFHSLRSFCRKALVMFTAARVRESWTPNGDRNLRNDHIE